MGGRMERGGRLLVEERKGSEGVEMVARHGYPSCVGDFLRVVEFKGAGLLRFLFQTESHGAVFLAQLP
jgi:hypothetical protein